MGAEDKWEGRLPQGYNAKGNARDVGLGYRFELYDDDSTMYIDAEGEAGQEVQD